MHTDSNALQCGPATGLAQIYPYSLVSGSDPEDEPHKPDPFDRPAAGSEDLPYKVELWDDKKQRVEQVLAVTANGSIGYAAFYAATREYPDRYVMLRHRNTTVARWNGPQH
ncbi:hypothetical protein [Virgifigura deserti]|uniref:hypothetical protein n=1 Tax=Virgifigura deserti TaxID=2268457 RepID=UPI003CCB8A39